MKIKKRYELAIKQHDRLKLKFRDLKDKETNPNTRHFYEKKQMYHAQMRYVLASHLSKRKVDGSLLKKPIKREIWKSIEPTIKLQNAVSKFLKD